jgi:hypothetical protein
MEDYIIKPFKMEELVRILLDSEPLPNSLPKVSESRNN